MFKNSMGLRKLFISIQEVAFANLRQACSAVVQLAITC